METCTFEEFQEQAKNHMGARHPNTAPQLHRINKNNGISLTALIMWDPGSNTAPALYLDGAYEALRRGLPMGEALASVEWMYDHAMRMGMEAPDLNDLDAVKDRVCFRLVNRESNREALKERPHRKFLDMAVVYAVELEGGKASVGGTDRMLRRWGISAEELHSLALANTPRLFPARISGMDEILAEMADSLDAPLPEPGMCAALYAASNTSRDHGAGVMLYGGLCRKFAERIGGSFYILPGSVHEVLFLPEMPGLSAGGLGQMVEEVNATQLAPEEVLSDSVYYYDASADAIRIAGR